MSAGELLERAKQALREGAYPTAQALFAQCISADPRSDEAYFGLALASALLDDFETAVDHFRACADINPRRASAHINAGIALMMLGRYDEAIQSLRQGLQLAPNLATAYYNLGLAYRKKGVLDLAVEAFREAIRKDPRMVQAYINLGNVLFDLGRYREAATAYSDGLQHFPDNDALREGYRAATKMLELKEQAEAATRPPWARAAEEKKTGRPAESTVSQAPPLRFATVVERAEALGDVLEQVSQLRRNVDQMVALLEGEVRSSTAELTHALVHSGTAGGQLELILPTYRESLEKLMTCAGRIRQHIQELSFLGRRFEASARSK